MYQETTSANNNKPDAAQLEATGKVSGPGHAIHTFAGTRSFTDATFAADGIIPQLRGGDSNSIAQAGDSAACGQKNAAGRGTSLFGSDAPTLEGLSSSVVAREVFLRNLLPRLELNMELLRCAFRAYQNDAGTFGSRTVRASALTAVRRELGKINFLSDESRSDKAFTNSPQPTSVAFENLATDTQKSASAFYNVLFGLTQMAAEAAKFLRLPKNQSGLSRKEFETACALMRQIKPRLSQWIINADRPESKSPAPHSQAHSSIPGSSTPVSEIPVSENQQALPASKNTLCKALAHPVKPPAGHAVLSTFNNIQGPSRIDAAPMPKPLSTYGRAQPIMTPVTIEPPKPASRP